MFDLIREDLKAHRGDWGAQGFWALAVYRFGRWRYSLRSPLLRKPCSLLYKLLYKLVQIVTGIELPCEVPSSAPRATSLSPFSTARLGASSALSRSMLRAKE